MKFVATVVLGGLAFAAPALADDRGPTADERGSVESALRAGGFTSWGRIELDDGRKWEVDDAIHSDGREYDVDLDLGFKIIKRDPD